MKEVKIEKCKFNQYRECEFFPCHGGLKDENFDCLFCYCPLYMLGDQCGGNFTTDFGIKDCSNCAIPHSEGAMILLWKKWARYVAKGPLL